MGNDYKYITVLGIKIPCLVESGALQFNSKDIQDFIKHKRVTQYDKLQDNESSTVEPTKRRGLNKYISDTAAIILISQKRIPDEVKEVFIQTVQMTHVNSQLEKTFSKMDEMQKILAISNKVKEKLAGFKDIDTLKQQQIMDMVFTVLSEKI